MTGKGFYKKYYFLPHVSPRRISGLLLLIALFLRPPFLYAQQDPKKASTNTSMALSSGSEPSDFDDIRDIKPLRPQAKTNWWFWGGVIGITLALAATFLWLWHKRRLAQRRQTNQPILTAEQRAIRDLQALHRVNFADATAVRRYYFTISEVVRTYVENRFSLTATQLTTEEIFQKLPLLVELDASENFRFRAFLAETDRVKYAKHQPTPEEITATHQRAVDFVRATSRPTVVEPSPEKVS